MQFTMLSFVLLDFGGRALCQRQVAKAGVELLMEIICVMMLVVEQQDDIKSSKHFLQSKTQEKQCPARKVTQTSKLILFILDLNSINGGMENG